MRYTTLLSIFLAVTCKFLRIIAIQASHFLSSVTSAIPVKPVYPFDVEEDIEENGDKQKSQEDNRAQAQANEKAVMTAADIGEYIIYRGSKLPNEPLSITSQSISAYL